MCTRLDSTLFKYFPANGDDVVQNGLSHPMQDSVCLNWNKWWPICVASAIFRYMFFTRVPDGQRRISYRNVDLCWSAPDITKWSSPHHFQEQQWRHRRAGWTAFQRRLCELMSAISACRRRIRTGKALFAAKMRCLFYSLTALFLRLRAHCLLAYILVVDECSLLILIKVRFFCSGVLPLYGPLQNGLRSLGSR